MRALITALLARRREFRERVQREATDLMNWMGEMAYAEARQRARAARGRQHHSESRLWAKVAVEIARRTGQDIGIKGADRYPDPGPRPREPAGNRREIADRLSLILWEVAALSAGRGDATTLHNIGVAARQIVGLAGSTPALVLAADEVIAACEEIRDAPMIEHLAEGLYPPAIDEAGRALRRLKTLALGS